MQHAALRVNTPYAARSRPQPDTRPRFDRSAPAGVAWHTVCLSPHFDDAALSLGGLLHRRAATGLGVLVVTVCAAPPPGALSAFAAAHHRRWGAGVGGERSAAAAMTATRRTEDEAALAALGVDGRWLEIPDAIYRSVPGGRWPYADPDSLFGPVDELEHELFRSLTATLAALPGIGRDTEVVAPLAVGGHVDHRLVRAAAEAWRGRRQGLRYYEDWPYAGDEDALRAVVDGSGLLPVVESLAAENVDAKVRAIACYGSQISTFWEHLDAMAEDVRNHALRRGRLLRSDHPARWPPPLAERLWHPDPERPAA